MSLLQIADGYIVQTVPGERLVYISLGRDGHVKPGMTFAVYSRVRAFRPTARARRRSGSPTSSTRLPSAR